LKLISPIQQSFKKPEQEYRTGQRNVLPMLILLNRTNGFQRNSYNKTSVRDNDQYTLKTARINGK